MSSGLFTLKQQIIASEQGAWSSQKTPYVDYLVVAGGGAGGGTYGSGGGAGGMLSGAAFVTPGSAITVTIGAGGAGVGNNIGNSGASSVFGSIAATGGGYGVAGYGSRAGSGGSGGGSGGNSSGSRIWGEAVLGQGNRGGTGQAGTGPAQGGGGGAGTAGGDGNGDWPAANGGNGLGTYIGGPLAVYAGGGGGGTYNSGAANRSGLGGTGGGGNAGAGNTSSAGSAGTANTGGGGGGASYDSGAGGTVAGGNGGSGIVIISYPDTYAAPASTTGSPTVSTSGSGSFSFNGSSQTISTASSSLLALGTGDFTIEFWVKINGSGSFSRSFLITGSASVSLESNTYTSAVTPYYLNYGGTQTAVTTGSSFDVTQWHHVAIVRSGVSIRVYLNGVQAMSATDATAYTSNGTLYLGSNNSANWLNGNVTNFRLVKGTAIYTSAFTPPSAPLTVVSGTSILTSVVSGAYLADSSGNGFTFTNTGSTAWNSASPFATGLGYKNRVYTWTSSGSITF